MSFFGKAKKMLSGVFFNGDSPGPAIEHADGSKEWFVSGKRHRADGPKVLYFKDGRQFTGEQWAELRQQQIDDGVAAMRDGLPENITVGRPLRYRTGFAAMSA